MPDDRRLFLDANVLFTAVCSPQGKAAFLFDFAGSPWTLISSRHAIEEARRNLQQKRPDAVQRLDALLPALSLAPQPAQPAIALALPEKDVPIWSAALAARATHLLTGDLADFGLHMNQPQNTAGICIQTVAQFLASLATA